MKFKVTKDAMRNASPEPRCFYCHQPIGENHKDDCLLINKKVTLKVTLTLLLETEVPAHWTEEQIMFNREEGSRCATTTFDEIAEKVEKENICLCPMLKHEYVGEESEPYLREKPS